jgi:hypothetical protein
MAKDTRKPISLAIAVAQAQALSGNHARLALTALLNAGYVSPRAFHKAKALAEYDQQEPAPLRQAAE